jgi:hypothetical protein
MQKIFRAFCLLLIIQISCLFSQTISYSLSNSVRLGRGLENYGEGGFVNQNLKKYFDYYSDGRLFYNNFNFGARFEYVDPPEYSLIKKGLTQRFVEFKDDQLSIRAGDSYMLFGRGLLLNLFENRMLAFNTALDGIKGSWHSKNLNLTVLYGKIDYADPLTVMSENPYKEKIKLGGGNFELLMFNNLTLGLSYINSLKENKNYIAFNNDESSKSELFESYLKFNFHALDFFINYAYKSTSLQTNNESIGNGFYSSISFSSEGFGLTFEYKNYNFDSIDPLKRLNQFRATRFLPFQNAPTCIKEHSFTLLTRNPHIIDFNDEVGFQLDAFYFLNSSTTLNLNFSMASRHNEYKFYPTQLKMEKINGADLIFPTLGNGYSPFWELYFEYEHFFATASNYFKAAFNRRVEILYDPVNVFNPSQPQRSTTFVFFLQYLLSNELNLKMSSESQWAYKYPYTEKAFTELLALQITYLQNYSTGLRIESTTSDYEPNEKKMWIVAELSYRFNSNNIITLMYGDERGGQICSTGLCRQVLPFSGLRISLLTNFN